MKLPIMLSLLIISFSCSNNTPAKRVETEPEKVLENTSEIKEEKQKSNEDKDELSQTGIFVFTEFWDKFKQAVAKNNIDELMELTSFPFETRGEMDSDPVVKYNEQEMRKLLPLLLKQEVILPASKNSRELVVYTEAQVVMDTKNVNREEIETGNVRISSLVFERGGEGWKFIFAYLNAPTREEIKNKP